MRRFLLATVAGISLACFTPVKDVLAQKISGPVKIYSSAEAMGMSGFMAEIHIGNGAGTNLSYINANEIIRKVWLDDPSEITFDTDGDLGQGANGNGWASVIHLRRIAPLEFPGLIKGNVNMLTVVTETEDRQRKQYIFRLTLTDTSPYHKVVIQPDVQVAALDTVSPAIELPGLRRARVEDVRAGVTEAIERGDLAYDDPLVFKIDNFTAAVENGESVASAMRNERIQPAIVQKLAAWGKQRIASDAEEQLKYLRPSPPSREPNTAEELLSKENEG